MKKFLLVLCLISITAISEAQVKTGIDVLKERNFDVLKGKRVGLITNPTGVDSKLRSTIDILFESKECKLTALYGPEHGVRGDFGAGDEIDSQNDKATGLPVFSLYGKHRKPSADMLKGIDVLVYDIQDIGCRSYTYISTMGLAMEAAAENNIEFVVLDRPNPLGGLKVEGNLVDADSLISFVSQFRIPYVYGLTCGELARMLNDEGMLTKKAKCKLTVVQMENWKREMSFEETGLQWVPTSPHVPFPASAKYYVTTGILGELGVVSEGVGYPLPFQTLAAEWIDADKLANKMNSLKLEGVIFRPIHYKPYYGASAKKELHGVQIHITDFNKFNLMSIQFLFMQVNNELYPDKNPFKLNCTDRYKMFDQVSGSAFVREKFMENLKYSDIKDFLEKDVKPFKEKSQKYYLYK